jgi:glycosyltransferase involved in cell wall biosynthesis
MASGLPVVAYDYAAAHLYIKHKHMGWLAPKGDQNGFAQYMQQLPHQKTLQQMGHQARQMASQIGWDYPVGQFEQALYRVARESVMHT